MATQILDTLAKISKTYKNAIPYKKYNLSENEYKVLSALYELGAVNSFAYLKEKVKLHDSQISVLLSGLNAKGFVVRKKSDNDRRSVDMNITDEGVQAMHSLKAEMEALEEKLSKLLGEENAAQYIELSNTLSKAFKTK